MAHPADYGLPHETWQKDQEESVKWALEGVDHWSILESSTGTGKTAIARALAHSASRNVANEMKPRARAITLVRTKLLQQENYQKGYGFTTLYGKANYECVHELAEENQTAQECFYADNGMFGCPYHAQCPYLIALDAVDMERGKGAAMNYALWTFKSENYFPDWLIFDEAHQLSDLVIEWAGAEVSRRQHRNFGLPQVPRIDPKVPVMSGSPFPLEMAASWLQNAIRNLTEFENSKRRSRSTNDLKSASSAAQLRLKLEATSSAIAANSSGWYIESDPRSPMYPFRMKPYSASGHFTTFAGNARSRLLMSATIGNAETLAKELGIREFRFRSVPSPFEPSIRPIYDLGVKRLGRSAPPSSWEHQADKIAEAIKCVDPNWHGIIHVTSKDEAERLALRLAKRGLQDRIWVPPRDAGTDVAISLWEERKRKVSGSIIISWAFHEGYDGRDEKICIVAKTPYPFLGDPYEQTRQKMNPKFYLQRTAWTMVQMLGRTRRGQPEDYDYNGEVNGLVCIADGGYRNIRGYMSEDVKRAIVQW